MLSSAIRATIFAVATGASVFGALVGVVPPAFGVFSCLAAIGGHGGCGPLELLTALTFGTYLLAWLAYAWMGLAWIENWSVPRWLPATGTLLALSWFVPFWEWAPRPGDTLSAPLVVLTFVAPAVLMAIYLCWFHLVHGRAEKVAA